MSTQGWKHLRPEDRAAVLGAVFDAGADCPGPFHLEIDPIDRCNADCYWCNSAEIRRGASLGWDRIEAILNDALPRGLRSIRLAGGGEAILHPQFADILNWLEANRVRLDNLTTNAVTMRGRVAEALLRVPPSYLMVSLNYATRERYEFGMQIPAANFDKVCDNIIAYRERLVAAGRKSECEIQTQFMISRETLDDLPAAFALAERLGADAVTIRGLYDRPVEARLNEAERRRLMGGLAPLARAYTDKFWIMFDLGMEGLAEEAAALSAEIHARHGADAANGAGDPSAASDAEADYAEFTYCLMPWYSLSVLGSGKVYPCCILLSNESLDPLGDLSKQSLAEVWNGTAFNRYREEIRRSMILAGPVPMSGRLCHHTTEMCWKAASCHLAAKLADPEEFRGLGARILRERASLGGRLTRVRHGLIRRGIDAARSIARS